jgi:hypothetical protein
MHVASVRLYASTPIDAHFTSRPAIRAASWLRASIPHAHRTPFSLRQSWSVSGASMPSRRIFVAPSEDDAKSHQRGLWRGAFIAPWDWRHRNEKTAILGTYSAPEEAEAAGWRRALR